jgi:putative ABC transport system permease protein
MMDGLRQDLRYGWRSLRARPGFTLVAVLTLALGVGANTAIFSAVNALLLRSLPVVDAERVVFGMALREGFDPFGTSLLEYALFRDEARSLASSGLGTPRLFHLVGSGEPERLRGSAVMTGYLKTLGVRPARGRLFTEDEDRPGGPAVALIGHDVWQRRFAGDRDVIGRLLSFEDRSYSIVGVMPPGFDLPYSAEVWVPMQVTADALPLDQRAANANEFVARLKPGVRLEQADTELKALARRLEREYPQIRRNWSYGIVPLRWQLLADIEGRAQRSLGAVGVAVGFLLLICCANVASLLLARGVTREGEIAIRLALGAGRARLARQLLAESFVLALLGGTAGVLAAVWIQPLLRALNPIQAVGLGVYLNDFRIDAKVLLFSLALTLLTGVVSGLVPALKIARSAGPMEVLKKDHRASGGARGRRSLRALVVGEIAVAATLLVGAGLMVQSFGRLQRTELGFRPDDLLTMELPLSPARHAGTAPQARFMEQVLDRVRTVPGVVSAGMTLNVPMQRGVTLDSVFEVEGRAPASPAEVLITAHRLVSPGYMETLGVSLTKGRFLDEHDRADAPPVVVVSEELVRQAWPGEDPLGKRIRRRRAGVPGPWMSVVGVVRDVKEDRFGFRIDRPVWYVPYAQQTFAVPVSLPLNLVVRMGADRGAVATSVRQAVHAVDPAQPVAGVMPMREYLADVLVADRFSAVLMATLAAVGLLLAALGLYGVMAYSVGQRRGEIGLRMALGARPRDVLRLVVGEGTALLVVGLLFGAAGAWTLTRLLSSTLYHVSPTDPATFAVVGLLLAGVALLASWLPARRATRISPMAALRSE